jgi:hypothetical protein
MKKIFTTIALALSLSSAMAQAFWTPTTYKGAFDCTQAMWTNGWTEWDPQNHVYPAPTVTITSNITTNTVWTSGNVYLLQGQIYVKAGATLTIQPGTIIQGSKSVAGSGLFICTGSKLIAVGTASQPIVFTSDQPVGSRSIGDWGGVILMGLADNNNPGGINNIEGIPPSADTQYGGGTTPNDNDNSGDLEYVRIEFPGYVYQPNKEINGLTFGAVGRGTKIDYIQVSFSNDDSFEWFGGSVNCKHLVAYRGLDDDFDTDNGFHGFVQFGLAVRDPNIADNPSVSTSEGFESDNDPSGTTTTPLTSAVFSNCTMIGPLRGSTSNTCAVGFRRGARIRRNSNEKIFNTIFMDHLHGVHIDGTSCEANASAGALKFAYNICAGNYTGMVTEHNSGSTFNTPSWFGMGNPVYQNDSLATTTGLLVNPYNFTAPDYRPVCTNTMIIGSANFSDPSFVAGGIQGINDLDQSVTYSGLVPNPTNGESSLLINTESNMEINVKVYSVTGQLVSAPYTKHTLTAGMNSLPLNVNLSTGIYMVNVLYGSKSENLKLVVNK